MSEIKFRGEKRDSKDWVFGELIKTTSGWLLTSYDNIYITHSTISGEYLGDIKAFPIKPETVGQYTGLKDKKETEIYDGDLLKGHNGKVYVILWDHGDARFVSVDLQDYKLDSESRFDEQNLIWVDCEVIGNIHSNSELLK